MSSFELVFAVYGLLLGLAIAEVLGGFARALKLKRNAKPVKIGWLTPLLGILVILDLTSFWVLAWDAQAQIGANYPTLLGVLAMVGIYYLAASLIFPDQPEEWPDFNDWYDKQNRMVIGGLLTANVMSWIGIAVLDTVSPPSAAKAAAAEAFNGAWTVIYMVSGIAILVLLMALLKVKSRAWNIAMLATLIALFFISGIVEPYA
ncbi:hypothetical protein M9978_00315 [Sphingomonas sp. MG17]|jgi:hypothetical protein|uniref:Uncharacterized protein n=1 Tax=Sphingomonas tagetis TaxID=2949092 RepID=A0A9X2KK13_9SPHN|nr:hypothetical protein [Sphingomonas tagetis]MCP3728861.1 hypothetical protein [Sphingomonas tagetis]